MSHEETIDLALQLIGRGVLLIATSSDEGVPHLSAVNSIRKTTTGLLAVTDWFCPGTVANAVPGRKVAVVIWDPVSDIGHQIVGRVAAVDEIAMLDGYVPGEDDGPPFPQEERRLLIEVEKILDFRRAPHSDIEE